MSTIELLTLAATIQGAVLVSLAIVGAAVIIVGSIQIRSLHNRVRKLERTK